MSRVDHDENCGCKRDAIIPVTPVTAFPQDVGWEILSVLAPVVCVALLGLIVLYALSRVPRRPQ